MSDPIARRVGGVINLNGRIGADGSVRGQLDGLRLDDWPAAYVPSRSRTVYERLALAGELAPTMLVIDENGQVE
eukprot:16532-Eustigmatos_ZCMA.PRE.1